MADDEQWYWCLTHAAPERGVGCRAAERMGPYPTEEAATGWRDTHEAREDAWAEDDDQDEDDVSA